ncbi:MAG: trehalose-phosphatase, partial [Chthoniobacteraceae bacterium]
PGILMEDKGLSATVHFRLAAKTEHQRITLAVRSAVGRCRNLYLREGKMAWEFRPRIAWHKGSALRWILGQLALPEAAALYLGDDATDEDVFSTMPGALTFRVGDGTGTKARYRVSDPADASALLAWLGELRAQR